VDYVGAPRNTKWLNVTQTQQMFEQLSLAYDFGIQRMWILNVGDLKPMEYPIQLFMDMAWNPKEYTQQTVTDHTRRFFEAMFALSSSSATTTYNLQTGEWRQVADDYARLERRALRLYQQVPTAARDAYVQSVLFPVEAMATLASTPSTLDSVTVHVVVKSTLDFLNVGGHEYTVSLDDSEPQVVNFNKTLVDRQPYMYSEFYPAVARRVVEKTITIPVSRKDFHELTLSPRHPGIVFEKIVIDFGGYQPQYLFGTESPYTYSAYGRQR